MNDRTFWFVTSAVSFLILAYAALIKRALLVGFIAVLLFVLVAFVAYQTDVMAVLGLQRTVITILLSVFVLVYALLIAGAIVYGFIAVGLLWLVAYVTSPRGPFA